MRNRFSVYQIVFAIILSLSLWGLAVQGRTVAQEGESVESTAEAAPEQPIVEPTQVPTEIPIELPTEIPTEVPTAIPTEIPTDVPTAEPTIETTAEATVSVTEEATEITPTTETVPATPALTEVTESLPPVPPLSRLVNDDFDNGSLSNWTLGQGWTLAPIEGGQALQTTYSDAPVTSIYNNIFDGAVIGRFLVSNGSARVSIRQSNVGGYSATLSADGQVDLYRADTLLKSALVNPSESGQWRELRLLAVGNSLRIAVDGIEVVTYLDAAPLPPGTVSFGVGQSGTVIWADDLQLWVPTNLLSFFATPIPTVQIPLPAQDDPMGQMAVGEDPILSTDLVVNSPQNASHSTAGDGLCSLSEAIDIANSNTLTANDCIGARAVPGNPDRIVFNITDTVTFGNPPYSILPEACPMPDITDPVHIDGYTQGDANSTTNGARRATVSQPAIILIELIGSSAYGTCLAANSHGFRLLETGGGSIIEGVSITRFQGDGINILGSDNNVIIGNYIGLDADGTITFAQNNDDGIQIAKDASNQDAVGNIIGGSTPGERNVISGNDSDGIEITGSTSTDNQILGNYIGLNKSGLVTVTDYGNANSGIYINDAPGNFIGDSIAGTRNVISANTKYGVEIRGVHANLNLVVNNYIGLSADGLNRIGNTLDGVIVAAGGQNVIGGTTAAERNIITGNEQYGVRIAPNVATCGTDNLIIGNYIGTNPAGTATVVTGTGSTAVAGNAKGGVRVEGCASSIVGGTGTGQGNLISGNQGALAATDVYGIYITNNANNSQVLGNYIGTNAAGTGAVPNQTGGIFIGSATNGPASVFVGGTANGARNLISGNLGAGIEIFGAATTNNRIRGNYIGTDVTGVLNLGNGGDGVRINGAPNNFVGGPDPADINIIAGNAGDGIEITGSAAEITRVQNNRIGLNINDASLPNTGNGVLITTSARRNIIGADPNLETDNSGNKIAYNGKDGVAVDANAGVGNSIMKNELHDNGEMGIDLGVNGPNPNDVGDIDTGANYLQNYPELILVTRHQGAGTLQIQGRLNSVANMAYRIDFFDNTSCDTTKFGEGQNYLGSILDISTDGTGLLTFDQTFPDPSAGFDWITFTATEKRPIGGSDKEFSTSEFSACINRNNNPPTISPVPMPNVTTNYQTATGNLPFTITDVEAGTLTLSGSSNTPGVVPSNPANFVFLGSGSSRTVSVIPATGANAYGVATITITVTDAGGATASTTFNLTVRPPNQLPTMSIISDQSTTLNLKTPPINITLNDPDVDGDTAAITLTASSNNTTLVPNTLVNSDTTPGYYFTGTGASRVLTIIPASGQVGTGLVTVTATDKDGGQTTRQFNITVSVNTPPTISNIVDTFKVQNAATGAIGFTIGDGQTNASLLQLSFSSSNTTLVPNNNYVFGGSATSRNVNITPVNGEYGLTTITVTVTDLAGTSASDSFLLGIYKSSNTGQPTITAIGDQVIRVSTPTNSINFTVGDTETAAVSIQVLTTSDNPTLVPNNPANITVTSGGNGSRFVVITPAAGQTGIANINLIAYDNEGKFRAEGIKVTVNPNNPPTITTTIANRSQGTSAVYVTPNFTINDDWSDEATLTIIASSSNTTLIPNANITSGTASATSRNLSIDPADGIFGTSTITVTVTDPSDGLFSSKTFLFSVADATDTPPTISPILDQTALANQQIGPLSFTLADTTPPSGSLNNLHLTYISSNTTLIPQDDAHITFGGTGGSRNVTITPAQGEIGTATITITVDDLRGKTASDSFIVTINAPPNTPPTITAIPNYLTRPGVAVGPVPFTVGDDRPISALTIDATSSNTTLIPNGNIQIVGTGADRMITVTPVGVLEGSTTITIIVTDGDLATAVENYDVVVAHNTAPTINNIADQTTPPNVQLGPVALVLSDDATNVDNLIISATSSNLTLVPNQNILIGGVGENRSLYIVPASGQTGTTTITITVSDNEGGSSIDTFVLTVILAPPQLTSPKEDSIVTKVKPTFTWRAIRNIRKYEIQIDDDPNFNSPLPSVQVSAASYTIPASGTALGQGANYWRVRALDTNGNPVSDWSAPGMFTISILKTPRDGAYTTDPTPTFTWYSVPGATSYTLLVDDDLNFGSPIADFCLSPTRTSCTPPNAMTPGTYYWKVNINGVVSPVAWSLIVTPSIPPKPTLALPGNGAKVNDPTPTLDWNPAAGVNLTYELLVDDAANFKTPLLTPPATTNTDFTFSSNLAEGRYYWKVRAVNQYGVAGPWSSYRSFIVDAILLISPADDAVVTTSKPTFRWGSAGSGATFQLQVDDDQNFGSPVTTCSSPSATRCTLPSALTPGVYYWRVNVNSQISPYVWSFIYTLPPPAAPKLVNPANNGQTNDSTPTLSWMPVTGATSYEIQVARSSQFTAPLSFTISGVTNPFTTVSTPLAAGRYLWRVRSVNNLGVPGRWSSARSFTVDTAPPTAPVLTAPVANATISDTTPIFKWRSISGIHRYWVQVASDAGFNTLLINNNQVGSASYTVPGPLALGAGTYYWRVRAIDPAGNIGPASLAQSFTIN